MIALETYRGAQAAVAGMGRSGMAVARSLRAGGARCVCWDDAPAARARARAAGFALAEPGAAWNGARLVALAPGLAPSGSQQCEAARWAAAHEVPLAGDIELYAQARAAAGWRGPLAAITGSNGKSTATAMLAAMLQADGRETMIGGNFDLPALALDPPGAATAVVLEVSSYQLETTSSLRPDVAAWLNLTPDHLDRHGDIEAYAQAKERLFMNQATDDVAVIVVEDARARALADRLALRGVRVVRVGAEEACDVVADPAAWHVRAASFEADLRGLAGVRGPHDVVNAAVALACAQAMGVGGAAIKEGLRGFAGLAHRLELVAERGGVRCINDSKATNAAAAVRALDAIRDADIFWLAGGAIKEGDDLSVLRAPVSQGTSRVAGVFLFGSGAALLAKALEGAAVPITACADMEAAARAALAQAASHGRSAAVLLAPAGASFDAFSDYAARGEAFRRLAHSWARAV